MKQKVVLSQVKTAMQKIKSLVGPNKTKKVWILWNCYAEIVRPGVMIGVRISVPLLCVCEFMIAISSIYPKKKVSLKSY